MKEFEKTQSYDKWAAERYKEFDDKIEHFKSHPKYKMLKNQADKAKVFNEGYGYQMMVGEDFIKKIESASLKYIEDWLDGKNALEWSGIKRTNIVGFYNEVADFEVKALVEDYTCSQVWINKNGVTTVFEYFADETIEEVYKKDENAEDFMSRIAKQSFAVMTIEKN